MNVVILTIVVPKLPHKSTGEGHTHIDAGFPLSYLSLVTTNDIQNVTSSVVYLYCTFIALRRVKFIQDVMDPIFDRLKSKKNCERRFCNSFFLYIQYIIYYATFAR